MAASPGGAAFTILKPVIRTVIQQARASTTNKLALAKLARGKATASTHHASFNFRKQVQRRLNEAVKTVWEGIARPIPSSAGRAVQSGSGSGSASVYSSRVPPKLTSPTSLLSHYASTISSAFLRTKPTFPRGPSIVSQVGLRPAPAHAFAYGRMPGFNGMSAAQRVRASRFGGSGGGQGRNYSTGKVMAEIGNVPIGMRALAEKLRESDEKREGRKAFRMRSPYQRNAAASTSASASGSRIAVDSKKVAKVSAWAAASAAAIDQEDFDLYFNPIVKDTEATFSSEDTHHLIPLSPSLSHLLSSPSTSSPSPSSSTYVPFLPTQEPIPKVPNLLANIFAVHSSFDTHARHRVLPLLVRLSGRGVFDATGEKGQASVEIIFGRGADGYEEPEALRLKFEGMTSVEVRELVGGSGAREWYHLYSVPRPRKAPSTTPSPTPTPPRRGPALGASQESLTPEENIWRMPTLDVSAAPSQPDLPVFSHHPEWDAADSEDELSPESGMSSLGSTPVGMISPSSSFSDKGDEDDEDLPELEPLVQRQRQGLSRTSASSEVDEQDLEGWTDAEMEFGSDSEEAFGSDMGEDERRVWSDDAGSESDDEHGLGGVSQASAGRSGPGVYLF